MLDQLPKCRRADEEDGEMQEVQKEYHKVAGKINILSKFLQDPTARRLPPDSNGRRDASSPDEAEPVSTNSEEEAGAEEASRGEKEPEVCKEGSEEEGTKGILELHEHEDCKQWHVSHGI